MPKCDPKKCLCPCGSGPPPSMWFLGPTQVHSLKGNSIGSYRAYGSDSQKKHRDTRYISSLTRSQISGQKGATLFCESDADSDESLAVNRTAPHTPIDRLTAPIDDSIDCQQVVLTCCKYSTKMKSRVRFPADH